MIKLTINKEIFELPESWDELKFSKYIDLLNINLDKYNSNTLSMIKSIAAIADKKGLEERLKEMSFDDLSKVFEAFKWMNEEPNYLKYKGNKIIEVDGSRYVIKADYDSLTANEIIMIEEINSSGKFDLHFMEIAFGVLLRKLDENGKEIELTVDTLLDNIINLRDKMYLKDVFPLVNFFLSGEKKSSTKTSKCSSPSLKIQKMSTQSKKKKTAKKQ